MLLNEIKILRKLKHPNIIKIHEVYQLDNEVCIVMEYANGKRLFDHIVNLGRVPEAELAIIMKQIFLALSYMEVQGVIHRDIKPENIIFFLDEFQKPIVKIIDFGLGTFHYRRDIIKKCGTAGYTAPEILNGDPYDFGVDLFSAGIVMYVWYEVLLLHI